MKNLWIDLVIEATIETLKTQCSLECALSKEVKTPDILYVGSSIEFSSGPLNGTLKILFPQETFLGVVSNMLGEEVQLIDEELGEAASEILNIIYGYAKKTLNDKGFELPRAFPVQLKKVSLVNSDESHKRVQFETSQGVFFIEFTQMHKIMNAS